MSGIDYSKWDNLVDSSDESASQESDSVLSTDAPSDYPRVQRFDQGTSVTIGPKGVSYSDGAKAEKKQTKKRKTKKKGKDSSTEDIKDLFSMVSGPKSATIPDGERGQVVSMLDAEMKSQSSGNSADAQSKSKLLRLTELARKWTSNGVDTPIYYWSQTQNQLEVRFKVFLHRETDPQPAPRVRGKDVHVRYDESANCLTVRIDNERSASVPHRLHFKNELTHEIIPGDVDLTCDSCVEWELITSDCIVDVPLDKEPCKGIAKVLLVTLDKKPISRGIITWWECVFLGGDKIDLRDIKGRKSNPVKLQQVWEQARAEFKRKVQDQKERGPEEIVVDDSDDDSDRPDVDVEDLYVVD